MSSRESSEGGGFQKKRRRGFRNGLKKAETLSVIARKGFRRVSDFFRRVSEGFQKGFQNSEPEKPHVLTC